MGTPRAALIATIGLAAMGCFDPGALMAPEPEGPGGSGGPPGAGAAGGRGGTGGSPGAAGAAGGHGGTRGGIALVTNEAGWLEPNPAGAVGSWWSANDSFGADGTPGAGDCPAAGFPMSACSTLTTPAPGTPFRPDPGGRGICASGTSAQVLLGSDGTPAWPAIWGNIIAFDLATADPTPMPVVGAYDALAHGITGFAFDIDAVPAGGHLRVMFATPGTEDHPAYWSGATNDTSPVLGPGHYEVRWPEVGGPFWFADPPAFDPTKIEWIAFHVVSTNLASVPFDFCLNNLALLTD
jgi:hypothetical protein